ncbi:MAG: hypothetical protein HC877_00020 [Thioploca sp.]|nr:hypothetical protein [Thioploca sp.]
MKLKHLYKFKKELDAQHIFFGFSGPLSQELFVEIGHTLRNRMKLEETNSAKVLKVFSLFVEQVQNVIHYSADRLSTTQPDSVELSHGVIVIGCENEKYYVMCGNLINSNLVDDLQNRLITLKNMDKEELKRYYKEQRKRETNENSNSKGAGLGFIELARKTTQPIEFEFQPVDEHLAFFSLRTFI